MLINSYNLNQVANSMSMALDGLKGEHPNRREVDKLTYYSGEELDQKMYDSSMAIFDHNSKFAYYLKQSNSNGTFVDVREYPHPLAVRLNRSNRIIISILDVGKLSQIVSGQDPEILAMRLPPMLRASYVLPAQDLNQREFELYDSREDWNSQNRIKELVELMKLL